MSDTLDAVLASAARLQQVVPDAVLVGGSAAALYAQHRDSYDHDHVLRDLQHRYAAVLEAVESTDGWATSVRASSPPLTLLGSLDGIEAGLRQLRRSRPLEVAERELPGGARLRVPTHDEILRIKAFLVVQRNQVRDYLDTAALAEGMGIRAAVDVLASIDQYYADRSDEQDAVLTALVQRLSEPNPRDRRATTQLRSYKGLGPRWHSWTAVTEVANDLADRLLARVEEGPR